MASRSLNPLSRNGAMPAPYIGNPFLALHEEMGRVFDDMFGAFNVLSPAPRAILPFAPQVDVCESDAEIRFAVDLPGIDEGDLDVNVNGDQLTIRGEKRNEREDNAENYHFSERSFGAFQRSFRLPDTVDPEKVSAEFENGVLRITAPKSSPGGRTRKVKVQGPARQREDGGVRRRAANGSNPRRRQRAH